MTKEFVLKALFELKKIIFPHTDGEVYLFGSHARGDFHKGSDWDILILTNDKIQNQESFNRYISPFAELGWELDLEINPIQYTREEWDGKKHSLFYHNVMQDAIRI